MSEKILLPNYASFNPIGEYAEVKQSGIQGFGLFAKKLIPMGTVWYHARSQDVLIISKDQWLTITESFIPPTTHTPHLVRQFIQYVLVVSIYNKQCDALVFALDDMKYLNHSKNANSTYDNEKFYSVTLRDIQPGEEITEDYTKYTKSRWARGIPQDKT